MNVGMEADREHTKKHPRKPEEFNPENWQTKGSQPNQSLTSISTML